METRAEDLGASLETLLGGTDSAAVLAAVEGVPAADLAAAARHLSGEQVAVLLKLLPEELRADVIVELDDDDREEALEQLTAREIADAVEEMHSDDAADVVSELEETKAGEVVGLLEEEDRREIHQLLAYPDDSAGGIMQLEVVSVRADRTVGRAIEKIRMAYGDLKEEFYFVFIVDLEGRLVGRIGLARLILAAPDELISNIMDTEIFSVLAEADQEDVARLFQKYDLPSLPVVDREDHLIGRITVDDIVDVIHEEAEEDYTKLAGTHEEELREDSVYRKAAIRLPWLVTGLFGGVLSAVVLSRFEESLAARITLTFFVPVITAMGGNVAIQSSAVMIRGIATGEVTPRDAMRRLAREVGVSVVTGIVCAALIFAAAWLWWGNVRLGVVVGGAMLSVVLLATSIGALVPLTLSRRKVDPALAPGPCVTSSNDILGIVVYLARASWGLGWRCRAHESSRGRSRAISGSIRGDEGAGSREHRLLEELGDRATHDLVSLGREMGVVEVQFPGTATSLGLEPRERRNQIEERNSVRRGVRLHASLRSTELAPVPQLKSVRRHHAHDRDVGRGALSVDLFDVLERDSPELHDAVVVRIQDHVLHAPRLLSDGAGA
jgi:magnesium transporter